MDFSLVTSTLDTLRLPPTPRLVLLEARTLADAHVPPFPPEFPALLMGVDSPELAAHMRDVLLTVYPREHEIQSLSKVKGQKSKTLQNLVTFESLTSSTFNLSTCLYIPALTEGTAFESFRGNRRAPARTGWLSVGQGADSPVPADASAGRILRSAGSN